VVDEANEQDSDTDPKVQEREQGGGLVDQPGGTCLCEAEICGGTIEGDQDRGSSLVAMLNKKNSVQIAISLPEADLAQARKIADRKGIGYQTLLKMLVREGLVREARRG